MAQLPTTLIGHYVNLTLLNPSHREALRETTSDPQTFRYFTYPAGGAYFDHQFDEALQKLENNERLPFVVYCHQLKKIVGSTSLYDIHLKHQRLAIGHTWYSIEARGKLVNPECKYLLLKYAFETLNFARVELHVDSRNLISRAAVNKLGAKEEGFLRSHMTMPASSVRRDTVIYGIIREDWPKVRQELELRLQPLI